MKSISFNRTKAKGFSLIELLLVLGVLAILLVAAFVVYPQVRDRNQANAEISNLTAIKANVNNLYASRGGLYTGLDNDVAMDARVYPSSMISGSASTSSWGQAVTVVENTAALALPEGGTIPAGRSFTVTYANVPEGVCLGLVSGAATNFQQVSVGGEDVKDANGFNPGDAAGACQGNQTIIFSSN